MCDSGSFSAGSQLPQTAPFAGRWQRYNHPAMGSRARPVNTPARWSSCGSRDLSATRRARLCVQARARDHHGHPFDRRARRSRSGRLASARLDPGASHTKLLTLDVLDTLLAVTADARAAFVDRHITSLVDSEESAIADIYRAFREFLGPVGAAKALGLLHSRFFPLWDSKIAIHYVGHSFRQADDRYVHFMPCCREQCSGAISEQEFGESLLKTLDEWNYCVWTQGWLPEPGR